MKNSVIQDKSCKLKEIIALLSPFYPDLRPLLNYETPFQLLVATVLAAQCTDAKVNTVTPELFRRFPGPGELANAGLSELETIIHPLGFFRAKARNIRALSQKLSETFHCQVPRTMEELTSFPGVGRKTASVILSVCFGQSAIIVDTHFGRVARRLGLTGSDDPRHIEADIAAAAAKEDWTRVSHVLNRFGRAICHAKKPECGICGVKKFCVHTQVL